MSSERGGLTERERERVRAAYATPRRGEPTAQAPAQTREDDGRCPVPLTGLVRLRDCGGYRTCRGGAELRDESAGRSRLLRLYIRPHLSAVLGWSAGTRTQVQLSTRGVAVFIEDAAGEVVLRRRKGTRQLAIGAAKMAAVTGWQPGQLRWDVRDVQGRRVLVLWQEAVGD